MCVNGVKGEQTCPDERNEQTRCAEIKKELKNQKGNDGVENHIREMVPPRIESVESNVDKVRENGNRPVVNEGFATQFSPVISGKGVLNCFEVTDLWVSQDKLAITCHKFVGECIPVHPHGYKSEEDYGGKLHSVSIDLLCNNLIKKTGYILEIQVSYRA